MSEVLAIAAALVALVGLPPAVATSRALRQRRYGRALLRAGPLLPIGLLLTLVLALLAGSVGYQALTREEVAAVVTTRPLGPGTFEASFAFPDGREAQFLLKGDELYVDARIVKWKYFANLLGLHTVYRLDRVGGRYVDLARERSGERTVYSLAEEDGLDLFRLRRELTMLAPLLDAQYGSATFIAGDRPASYEIRVSTTGLLARPAEPS